MKMRTGAAIGIFGDGIVVRKTIDGDIVFVPKWALNIAMRTSINKCIDSFVKYDSISFDFSP